MSSVCVVWVRSDDGPVADRLLRDLVASRYGVPAERVATGRICPRCASTLHGRPVVRIGDSERSPGVSISRTSGVTVVALSDDGDVGVDVERADRFSDPRIADVVLHPDERAGTREGLAATWVRKEALLKASGHGLSLDPATIRLGCREGAPVVLHWPAPAAPAGWLLDLALADDLSAAIAGSTTSRPGELTVRRAAPAGPRG